jgi:hypothetical protein
MHSEKASRRKVDDNVQEGAVPAYLLDRDVTTRAKVKFQKSPDLLDLCFPALFMNIFFFSDF